MKTHIDEDLLLKLNLDLLKPDERAEIEEHLKSCEQCREIYEKLSREAAMLGGLELNLPDVSYPLKHVAPARNMIWLKAAAILMIGFLAGFAASTYTQPECVNVVPFTPRPAKSFSQTAPIACESEILQAAIR